MEQDDDNIMIDLETLGLKQSAPIISIGAVRFDIKSDERADTFHQNITWESALKYGEAESATVKWWQEQSGVAKDALTSPTQLPIEEVMSLFREWLGPDPTVWGNGACFDLAKLEHYFDIRNEKYPWFYRDTRDVRTIEMLGREIHNDGISDQEFQGTKHHPVDDAVNTARYVQRIYYKMKQGTLLGWN